MAVRECRLRSLLPTEEAQDMHIEGMHTQHSTPPHHLFSGYHRLAWHAVGGRSCTPEEMNARMQAHDMNAHKHAWHTSMALAGMSFGISNPWA